MALRALGVQSMFLVENEILTAIRARRAD